MNPIFDTTRTKEIIEYRLSKAEKSIDIAMAWFTDTNLSEALLSAAQGTVKIRVMLQDDDINRNSKINWNVLCSKNIELYWYKAESALMHHKFCVIDKRVCLFGTYNWTFKAQ